MIFQNFVWRTSRFNLRWLANIRICLLMLMIAVKGISFLMFRFTLYYLRSGPTNLTIAHNDGSAGVLSSIMVGFGMVYFAKLFYSGKWDAIYV